MDKQTLSNYGWLVIVTLVLAVMLALATPFGIYIGDAVVSVANGFVGSSNQAIDEDNISNLQNKWDEKLNSNTGSSTKDPALNPTGVTITDGNYKYGDYRYEITPSPLEEMGFSNIEQFKLNCDSIMSMTWDELVISSPVSEEQLVNRLSSPNIRVYINTNQNQTTYGAILESINGQPVTDMTYTFRDCTSLTTVPEIPSSVTDMSGTFYNCTSLTDVSNLVIPNGVISMFQTFYGCTSLTTAPEIPSSVMSIESTFRGCTSLTTAPTIPNSVITMADTFYKCTSLTIAPEIPTSVIVMPWTFMGCTSLTDVSNLVIPSSVIDMTCTFYQCTSLTGTITINATPETYNDCLGNTKITSIAGACTIKSNILATK